MDVTVREGGGSVEEAADRWRALWDRDPDATPFQRPEYLGIWLQEFGADRRPIVVEVDDGGALVGLAVFSVDPDGVLRFLGDVDVTDYFGPISTPELRDDVAHKIVEGIASVTSWKTAELAGMSAGAGWADALARAAKDVGLDVDARQQEVTPRIALGGTFDDYLASLDGKQRHEIRRKARKLERDAGSYRVRLVTGADVHDELERFFDMHRSSEGPKGHFLHWGMAGFFILLARTLADLGWLRLTFLDVDGHALAGVFSYSARGTFGVYNAAYDASRRELGAGMVLMAETIRLACEEGVQTFDFLRGDEPYKYRFGAVDTPLHHVTLRRG